MDCAHRARCYGLVYGDRASIAVMGRARGVAVSAASLGLFLFASFHFFGFLEAATIFGLALVGVHLVSGFPAHHPEIDRPLPLRTLATRWHIEKRGGRVERGCPQLRLKSLRGVAGLCNRASFASPASPLRARIVLQLKTLTD